MIGDLSRYVCPKCQEPLKEGPAIVWSLGAYPLLGCTSCNAVYTETFLKESGQDGLEEDR